MILWPLWLLSNPGFDISSEKGQSVYKVDDKLLDTKLAVICDREPVMSLELSVVFSYKRASRKST